MEGNAPLEPHAIERVERVYPLPEIGENVTHLVPYVPGKPVSEVKRELGLTDIIKLASNENALGPSPRSIAAVQEMASKMHIYPDAASADLRTALATKLNVHPDMIVVGNGSDEIIHLLGITLLKPCDEIIQADPSFVRYEAAGILNDSVCHMVPLTADFKHDLDAMMAKVNSRTRLVFVCNPNNPTSTIVGRAELQRFIEAMPPQVVVVLDEAYYEYAAIAPEYPDALEYVRAGRNVVVLRTFSKAFGLAGHRVGYGVMRREIADWLNRTREPFNVNYLAQVAAIAALEDDEHVRRTVETNELGKQYLYAAFKELGLTCTPSYGNFVWVDTHRNAKAVFDGLLRRGIIVRVSESFRAPSYMRVTIGTAEENSRFVDTLRIVLDAIPDILP